MPNGKTHDKITIITIPLIAGLVWFIFNEVQAVLIITSAYTFASFMFNGDLDTVSKPYNRWWLFKVIWIPYQLMFTHRSIFTHGIIIGTVVRILYLGILPFICLIIFHDINLLDYITSTICLYILIGLELGNTIHTLSDRSF